MALNAVNAVATAITEGFKLLSAWMKSKDKRRMQAAIEAGEKYIQINEDNTLADAVKKKRLRTYKKRFFKYN